MLVSDLCSKQIIIIICFSHTLQNVWVLYIKNSPTINRGILKPGRKFTIWLMPIYSTTQIQYQLTKTPYLDLLLDLPQFFL